MEYIVITIVFLVLMLIYFRIAERYNIIDKPNHRSNHSEITIRGCGIIYPIAFLLFFIGTSFNRSISEVNYLIFGVGLFAICIVSFIDDIRGASIKVRLLFHFISVTFLLYFINVYQQVPIFMVPVVYIFIIGILNAYNFMDGINGMSGLHTLVVLGSLLFVNQFIIQFAAVNFIVYPILASLVFLFFNYRKKAKCFMGDVGSLGIAFWIVTLLGLLILKTGELKWLLFLTIYGVETFLTIIERIKLKENVFEAHRRHLYELFSYEKKIDHRIVSFGYAFTQMMINIAVTLLPVSDIVLFPLVVVPSVIFYLIIKNNLKKQIVNN